MDSRVEKALWFGVSTAIFAGLIYFADLGKFLDALASASLVLLVPAFVAGFSVFFVFGYTWHRFMRKVGIEVSYFESLKFFFAGQFMNSVTPLGQFGGEPFMAYIVQRNTGASYEKSLSTVFSADVVNAIPMLTFLLGGTAYLFLFSSLNSLIIQVIYAGIVLTGLGGLIVYLLWFKAGSIESYILRLLRYFSGVIGRGESLVERAETRLQRMQNTFESIGENPRHLFQTAVVAHIYFVLQVICLYFVMLSFGVSTDFTPLYFIIAISSLANFAPTPGGSGAFEASMAAIMSSPLLLGIDFEVAVAAAIIFRLTTYWPGLLVGYLSLLSVENGGGE